MEGTNYLEYIIPIIFIAIWVIGKAFSGKREESDKEDGDSSDTVYEYPEKEKFERVLQSLEKEIDTEMPSKRERIYHENRERIDTQQYKEISPVSTVINAKISPVRSPSRTISHSGQEVSVLKFLKDSNSLKKSFVIAEILNPPLSLREDARTREMRRISK